MRQCHLSPEIDRPIINGFVIPTWVTNNPPPPHDVPMPAKTFSEPITLTNQAVAAKIAHHLHPHRGQGQNTGAGRILSVLPARQGPGLDHDNHGRRPQRAAVASRGTRRAAGTGAITSGIERFSCSLLAGVLQVLPQTFAGLNPKTEGRSPKEFRNPGTETLPISPPPAIRISAFGFFSCHRPAICSRAASLSGPGILRPRWLRRPWPAAGQSTAGRRWGSGTGLQSPGPPPRCNSRQPVSNSTAVNAIKAEMNNFFIKRLYL